MLVEEVLFLFLLFSLLNFLFCFSNSLIIIIKEEESKNEIRRKNLLVYSFVYMVHHIDYIWEYTHQKKRRKKSFKLVLCMLEKKKSEEESYLVYALKSERKLKQDEINEWIRKHTHK